MTYLRKMLLMLSFGFVLCVNTIMGAGSKANPAISTAGTVISVTNGPATCHIDDANDVVLLSVSGGSDQDCDQAGSIVYSKTRWTYPSGELDKTTGSTNEWMADAAESGVVIRVYLNDDDSDPDYDDDESGIAATKEVTGFKVGVQVTSSPSGGDPYVRWENGTTSGTKPTESLNPHINLKESGHTPIGTDIDSDSSLAQGTWTLMTYPVLGQNGVKGNITAYGKTASFDDQSLPDDYGIHFYVVDEDDDDNGAGQWFASFNSPIISFGWNAPDLDQPDLCYGYAGGGLVFGSNFGASVSAAEEDHSDNITNDVYTSAAMSASGQSWTDKPTTTRWGKWEAKVEGGIGWSATEGAEVTAEVDVDVEFDHHANPTYSYTPS